jgi:hypothetical protein
VADEPQPPELTELILCRDVYHCLPSQLDAEDYERVLKHMICAEIESQTRQRRVDDMATEVD